MIFALFFPIFHFTLSMRGVLFLSHLTIYSNALLNFLPSFLPDAKAQSFNLVTVLYNTVTNGI